MVPLAQLNKVDKGYLGRLRHINSPRSDLRQRTARLPGMRHAIDMGRVGVSGIRALVYGERGQRELIAKTGATLLTHGEFSSVSQMRSYVDAMVGTENAKWFTLDFFAVFGTFGVLHALEAATTAYLIKHHEPSVLTTAAVSTLVFSGAIVHNAYMLGRLCIDQMGAELKYINKQIRDGHLTKQDRLRFLAYYAGIFGSSFIPFAGDASMVGVGVARNEAFIKKVISAHRRKKPEKEQYYDPVAEVSLSSRAHCAAWELTSARSPIVLTASESGHPDFIRRTQIFSRAHKSMADAVAAAIGGQGAVDVLQFVNSQDRENLVTTSNMVGAMGRHPLLHKAYLMAPSLARRYSRAEDKMRDVVAHFAKLLADNDFNQPIVSLHYGVANVLLDAITQGKLPPVPVVHYITDPHVHAPYLTHKDHPQVFYFVFDQETREELVARGVDTHKVFITGYPFHESLPKPKHNEIGLENRKLHLAVFTGGAGTNINEIETIASSFDANHQQVVFYCGTHYDILERIMRSLDRRQKFIIVPADNVDEIAFGDHDVVLVVGNSLDPSITASYKILEWADVVATKPSGDIGIEAVMAGRPIVPLDPWGPQEDEIHGLLQEIGATIDVVSPQKIAAVLNALHQSGDLQNIIDDLRGMLDSGHPFITRQEWQKQLKAALSQVVVQR